MSPVVIATTALTGGTVGLGLGVGEAVRVGGTVAVRVRVGMRVGTRVRAARGWASRLLGRRRVD